MYNHSRSIMALLMMLALLSSTGNSNKSSEAECKKERRLGMIACKPLAHGYLPSPECCERMRNTNPECVCPLITPEMAAKVDIQSALRIAESCGITVPRPFQCGSLVIPNEWSPLYRLKTLFSNKRWFMDLLMKLFA
ncbi:OLC1v1031583C1 [Oldenlandia corymbosa var. corymbosa]|uniref:OLC1v1031583C1 n=1 Tax=Oldenlandia corymbosa var. corymbosa TaxID=529605 RepID=A0AAV1CKQ0_OLDCO|nr:OLC1v1031583C1 [Oldenlandia corymbosa var. corymbosa]